MQSSVGMKSVPADMLVFDELDEATPDAKALARERLAHSDYKRTIELSNSSLPDQRQWMTKCPGCLRWVSLAAECPKNLDEQIKVIRPRGDGSYYRACPKCSAERGTEPGQRVTPGPGPPGRSKDGSAGCKTRWARPSTPCSHAALPSLTPRLGDQPNRLQFEPRCVLGL